MIKEDFQKCFSLLEDEFGEQSKELEEIWYELFGDYKVEDLDEAIKHYLKKIKKFPVPANIIGDIEWLIKDKAEKSYWKAIEISNKDYLNRRR